MSKVTNLRTARKARARADKRARADANAARHGETKAERKRSEAEMRLAARRLDQHRRDGDDPEG